MQRSSSIEWSLFATEDDPCRHYMRTLAPMKGLVHPRDFKIAKRWLQECGASHKDCPNQTQTALPTRLIELSPPGVLKIARLRSTAGKIGIYTALSYCWGGSQPFKTTLSNVSTYEESLPYANLPKTILDAFEVARNLHFYFIWIDSLGIIQDDEADVHRELAEMVQVYQNAKLTISAASSFSCQEGFLEPSYHCPTLFHVPGRVTKDTVGTLISDFEPKLGTFGRIGASNSGLEPRTLLIEWGFFGYTWKHILNCDTEQKALNMWESLVRNYTKRELSRQSDRLRAIAAAAEVFSYRLHCDYLAGLWMRDLLWSLKWRVHSPKPRPQDYQAPSWSWVSVNGPILYDFYDNTDNKLYTVRVMECSTILASERSKWDAVTAGRLVIFGYLEEVMLGPDRTQISPLGRNKVQRDRDGVYWDNDWRASPDHSFDTTWLLTLEISSRAGVDGLILGKATSDANCYRWLAYFHTSGWLENPVIAMI
ncbi:uncharacterized protein PAC_19615 [Phialocephala subalpina]|uniref:Heterokaryon incompatibility domain-containing protein n=1 Tax=Phialocephala subalpina TaxID=576137 RepID=A0A1L7XXR0_9HELO|nr:uncharacterized protein PAC_19615 [Phialocephala subalpina]